MPSLPRSLCSSEAQVTLAHEQSIRNSFWFSLQSLPQIYPLLFIFTATPFGRYDYLWLRLLQHLLIGVLSSTHAPFQTILLKVAKEIVISCIKSYTGFPFHLKKNPNFLLRPIVSQIMCPLSIFSTSVLPLSTQLNNF